MPLFFFGNGNRYTYFLSFSADQGHFFARPKCVSDRCVFGLGGAGFHRLFQKARNKKRLTDRHHGSRSSCAKNQQQQIANHRAAASVETREFEHGRRHLYFAGNARGSRGPKSIARSDRRASRAGGFDYDSVGGRMAVRFRAEWIPDPFDSRGYSSLQERSIERVKQQKQSWRRATGHRDR